MITILYMIILAILIFGLGFCFGVLYELRNTKELLKTMEKNNNEWSTLCEKQNKEWSEYCQSLIDITKTESGDTE